MTPTTLIKVSLSFSVMLGIASAGAIFYANDAAALRGEVGKGALPMISEADEPTSATIAAWKATARASDYLSPRVPI